MLLSHIFFPPQLFQFRWAQLYITFLRDFVWPFFQEFSEAPPHGGEPKG